MHKIPREIFWKDRKSMEEFADSELFKALHEIFLKMSEEPMLFKMDELTIMNEVGYEVSLLQYEDRTIKGADMEQFVRDVFASTGSQISAEVVFSLVCAVVHVVGWPPIEINDKTRHQLLKLHQKSWCKKYIDEFVNSSCGKEWSSIDRFQLDNQLLKEYFQQLKKLNDSFQGGRKKYIIPEENDPMMCAEATPGFNRNDKDNRRRFYLDDIVNYAKENLTVESSFPIQSMLYALLVKDGTEDERKIVNSITSHIIKRDKGPNVIGQYIAHADKIEATKQ